VLNKSKFSSSGIKAAINEYNRCLGIFNEISGVVAIYEADGKKVLPETIVHPESMTPEEAIKAKEQEVVNKVNMASAELDMALANIQLILAREKFVKNGIVAKTPISPRQITLNL
jgi:hypothetical protein